MVESRGLDGKTKVSKAGDARDPETLADPIGCPIVIVGRLGLGSQEIGGGLLV